MSKTNANKKKANFTWNIIKKKITENEQTKTLVTTQQQLQQQKKSPHTAKTANEKVFESNIHGRNLRWLL